MTKIKVVDNKGIEFSEMEAPISFNISINLEEGMSRYQIRLIDDMGNTRGYYTGITTQKTLNLFVPLIKLPKPGKLRVLVEESTGGSDYSHQHQISVLYLEYGSKEDISEINKDSIKKEKEESSLPESIASSTDDEDIPFPVSSSNISDTSIHEEYTTPTEIDENQSSLSEEEIEYLSQREKILRETDEFSENDELSRSSETKTIMTDILPIETEEEE